MGIGKATNVHKWNSIKVVLISCLWECPLSVVGVNRGDAVQQYQEEDSWNVIVLENMLGIDREGHFHDTIPTPPTPNLDCKHHTKI